MSDNEEKSGVRSPVDRHDVGNGEKVNGSDKIKSSRDKRSRSRSRSGRRSSSKDRSSRYKHRRSHSRSRSYSRHRRHRSRSRSHSYNNDKNYRYGRNNKYEESPQPNRCVGVFGMSLYTDEKTISRHFSQFGKIENIQLVYDRKTNRSRGFGFVYFDNIEDATNAKENSAGVEIDGHRIRVDYSLTKRPHTPTPGIYMGKRGYREDYYRDRRRSPSPHGYRGSRRSRSHSYSPRH